MSRRPYNRLPDYIEDARLEAIALSLDIRRLVEEQWQAMQNGDWPDVADFNSAIDARAKLIQLHMQQMKRLGVTPRQNGR